MDIYKCNLTNTTIVKFEESCPDIIKCPNCKNHNIYKFTVPNITTYSD